MGSLCSKYGSVKYLLYMLNVFAKYSCIKPLKDQKGKTVLHGFIGIVNESKHKPNNLWVDQEK